MHVARRRRWSLRRPAAGMVSHTAWNGLSQLVPQLVSLAIVPLLLSRLGVAGYGVWALTGTLLIFAVSLDGGITSSAQRFYVLFTSREQLRPAADFTALLLSISFAFSFLFILAGPAISSIVLTVADIPRRFEPGAAFMFRNIGYLVGLILWSNILTAHLRAQNRFRNIALNTIVAQGVFVSLILASSDSLTIERVFLCALGQLSALNLMLIASCWRHLLLIRLRVSTKQLIVEFASYAWRAQVMNLSSLAILQTDSLFVAVLLPIEQLGYLALGAQVASAARSLPLFAIAPIMTRITREFGIGGLAKATQLASGINRVWLVGVVHYGVIAAIASWFIVSAWAGSFVEAQIAASILIVGNLLNLSTAIATSYCRSIGRPGLEARYGLVLVAANLLLSWPSTYFFGIAGAVTSTALVQLVALLYFSRLLHRQLPDFHWSLPRINVVGLIGLGASTFLLELVSLTAPSPSSLRLSLSILAAVVVALVGGALLRKSITRVPDPSQPATRSELGSSDEQN